MLNVKVSYNKKIYCQFNIDFEKETIDIIKEPDKDINLVDNIFKSSGGLNYENATKFLMNRNIINNQYEIINKDIKTHTNVATKIEIDIA